MPELSAVGAEDLLLVSEHEEIDGVSRYFSKKLKYSTLSSGLYAQFDMGELTAAIYRNSGDIAILSGNVSRLSSDLYRLSSAFLSNDALTRLIPAISSQVIEISNSLSDAQPIDRIVDLSDGIGIGIQLFQLSNYAVNVCHANGPVVKFRVPDQDYNGRPDLSDGLSNITRHLVIDLSSDVDTIPRFMNNCRYISDFDLTSTVSAGEHVIFTMKEVEKDLMYVTRRNVLCVDSGTGENEALVALVYYAVKQDKTIYDIFSADISSCISDYPDHCYQLSDVKPPSKYFSHWVDTQYPTGYIKFQDYPSYYISADLVLCAIYSDVAPIMVYFYGCIPNDSISSYGPLVKDVSPQYFGVNMSAAVPDGYDNEVVVPGIHIPTSAEFLAWAEESPYGPAHVVNYPPHWSLSEEELSSGTAELRYYVIAKPIQEYQTSAVLSVDDGIASVEPIGPDDPDDSYAIALELDWNYELDTDWGDGIFFRGKTTTELYPGSSDFPDGTGYYNTDSEDQSEWIVPTQNDVVMVWKTSQEYIWEGSPWRPPADD